MKHEQWLKKGLFFFKDFSSKMHFFCRVAPSVDGDTASQPPKGSFVKSAPKCQEIMTHCKGEKSTQNPKPRRNTNSTIFAALHSGVDWWMTGSVLALVRLFYSNKPLPGSDPNTSYEMRHTPIYSTGSTEQRGSEWKTVTRWKSPVWSFTKSGWMLNQSLSCYFYHHYVENNSLSVNRCRSLIQEIPYEL